MTTGARSIFDVVTDMEGDLAAAMSFVHAIVLITEAMDDSDEGAPIQRSGLHYGSQTSAV
jgi:hypothetical protein